MTSITERVERELGVPGIASLLAERLEPSDLQSLLLDVYRRVAKRRPLANMLADYETNRFVREMSRALRISRRRISFAGTKDRRAVTTQLFQFDGVPELLEGLHLKDVEVLETFRTDRKLEIGDLLGVTKQSATSRFGPLVEQQGKTAGANAADADAG